MIRLIEWCVNCFDKQTEELAQDLPLTGVTLRQLQELFNVPADELMSDSYRIEPWHAEKLQPFLSEKLDLKNCNCYLDGYAIKVE